MKTEDKAHEEWVAYGFPNWQPMWRNADMARHVVAQFADWTSKRRIVWEDRVQVRLSETPIFPYATTQIGKRTHDVVYDRDLLERPPCMIVGSLVHELFHVLVWESLPWVASVGANDLTDDEHETLAVAAEHLCLFPGVADLTFDALDEAWSVRLHHIDPALTAAGYRAAIKARVEVMGQDHTEPMMPETAARVFRTMLCQFTQDRGYGHGT